MMPTIPELIETWAEQSPKAPAILGLGRKPLSYEGLRSQVEHSIQTLQTMGVGRNDRVAIVLPNGPEMATAFLAVSCCAISVPLNPALSAAEFKFQLADLRPKVLLVCSEIDSPARSVAQAQGIPSVELSSVQEAEAGIFVLRAQEPGDRAGFGVARPDDVALALYTSGTTSRPKLVPLTHSNLCASALHMKDTYALDRDDRCLNIMPLFHIHGLSPALLTSLASGGSIVCTPGFDAARFFCWLDAFKPTWYTAVPTMHLAILGQAEAGQATVACHSLKFICSRSAALPTRVRVELERVFGVPTLEAYGLTEASPHVASHRPPPHTRRAGSVGKAAGPDVAIMSADGNLVAAEKTGEIVVRGDNVFSGYEGQPKANKNAFVDGWFRTGDLGYLDEDGYLSITGRIKEIINRGGEKLSPREVDDALLENPAIEQAVTFAVPHPTLGEDVAAATVLRKGATLTEQEIRDWAFDRLAAHKVPSQVLILDQVPTGPMGKVQRAKLAEELAFELSPPFVAPRNQIEEALAKMWAEVIGLDRAGVYDNFFALGGDSLSATRLVSRVRVVFHVELPLDSVFAEPVLAGQALIVNDLIMSRIEGMSEAEAQSFGQLG